MISIGCQLPSTTRDVTDSSPLRGLMSVGGPRKLLISRVAPDFPGIWASLEHQESWSGHRGPLKGPTQSSCLSTAPSQGHGF